MSQGSSSHHFELSGSGLFLPLSDACVPGCANHDHDVSDLYFVEQLEYQCDCMSLGRNQEDPSRRVYGQNCRPNRQAGAMAAIMMMGAFLGHSTEHCIS